MNYALSKRNLLFQVLYAVTRFYLYYQDELQMEKCLMEYSLTSLFSILFFPQWALLVGNCLGYTVDLVLRKKMKKYVPKQCQTHQSLFIVLLQNAEPFLFNRNICCQCLLHSLATYYSQKANQFSFLGKSELKIMFEIGKTPVNRFLWCFVQNYAQYVQTHIFRKRHINMKIFVYLCVCVACIHI